MLCGFLIVERVVVYRKPQSVAYQTCVMISFLNKTEHAYVCFRVCAGFYRILKFH